MHSKDVHLHTSKSSLYDFSFALLKCFVFLNPVKKQKYFLFYQILQPHPERKKEAEWAFDQYWWSSLYSFTQWRLEEPPADELLNLCMWDLLLLTTHSGYPWIDSCLWTCILQSWGWASRHGVWWRHPQKPRDIRVFSSKSAEERAWKSPIYPIVSPAPLIPSLEPARPAATPAHPPKGRCDW